MSVVAERPRASLTEPDRLAGFSSPREVVRLFGHDEARAEFAAALAAGRVHHAWLLAGPEGVGKATLAYHFARMLLAHDTAGVIDATHPVFRKVAALSHPNLLLLRRSWNEKSKRYSQWIGVDEVRRLRAFLGNTAGEAAWRAVVVDRADELNQNAANALLKVLEEPPAKTVLFLISSAEGLLPVTIRSRCRTLRVEALSSGDLEAAVLAALGRDGPAADADMVATALALSQGSVRRALDLAASNGIELYREILAALSELPELAESLHGSIERLSGTSDTERLELYLALLLGLIERLVRFAATGEGATKEEQILASRLVSTANLPHWAELWETIAKAKTEAVTLNLDRSLLVLETWFRLQRLVREHPV
jgi:DNA polymerase-3 subunit delta'